MRSLALIMALTLAACADYAPLANKRVENECQYDAAKATATIRDPIEKVWTGQDIMAACRRARRD